MSNYIRLPRDLGGTMHQGDNRQDTAVGQRNTPP